LHADSSLSYRRDRPAVDGDEALLPCSMTPAPDAETAPLFMVTEAVFATLTPVPSDETVPPLMVTEALLPA
jgi:hypothetical protein